MTFKDHFSGHAARYVEARPHYPRELYAWLANRAPARALAWDAGCGNGQAACALAEHFDRVLATDPSAAQIEHARPHARVQYRVEPAEACSALDASVDLVTVAQALHWFDHARFNAEVRRVLVPGGLVAAWSYERLEVAPAIDAAIERLYVDTLGPYWPPERRHVEARYATIPFPFERVPVPDFAMRHDWTLEQLLGYLETWSALQRYRRATGTDPLPALRAELRPLWGDDAQARPLTWPLTAIAGRV